MTAIWDKAFLSKLAIIYHYLAKIMRNFLEGPRQSLGTIQRPRLLMLLFLSVGALKCLKGGQGLEAGVVVLAFCWLG